MEKIKIITDSSADIPKEVLLSKGVDIIPIIIQYEDREYLDGENLTFPKLADMMQYSDKFPTTAGVNPQYFVELYKKYLDEGYKIISIHLSSKMSGMCQSAEVAKQSLETEDITIIDSYSVTNGLGILVLKACKLRDQGLSAREIENSLLQLIPHIKSSLVFGSLDNLVKGGRLSKTAGAVGSFLGIKLVVEVKDGMMEVREKVRGDKKVVKRALDFIEEKGIKEGEDVTLITSGNEEIKQIFKKYCEKKGIKYIETQAGCAVGVHAGTTAAGIFFIENY